MEDKYCRFCGALLPKEALFCAKCGKATAVRNSEPDESMSDYPESVLTEQSPVTESGDEERDQGERDVAAESANNADDEPHWLKRSEDQLNRETEAARERRVDQQRQKWNHLRTIVITAIVAVILIIGAVQGFRKYQESSGDNSDTSSSCYATARSDGSIVSPSCNNDSKDNPSATLRYLYQQLSSEAVSDESVQMGNGQRSAPDTPYLAIESEVKNLNYGSGVLWNFGELIGEDPAHYLQRMVADALGVVGWNESVLGFNGILDETGVDKLISFGRQVPYYRYSVSGYGDVVVGVIPYSVDGGHQFSVEIYVYDSEDVPDWLTNIHDSNQTSQSSSTLDNNQAPSNNDSTSVDTDFTDLWTTTVDNNDWSKIAGDYCRTDDVCVHIAKNDSSDPNTYDETPGTLSFTAGDSSSNPLPNSQSQVELGFQYQSEPIMPSSPEPFPMYAGCQASAGCEPGSQKAVHFVMPGVDTKYFQQKNFSYDSDNPPDGSRNYLVIGKTTISDQTVFYRK